MALNNRDARALSALYAHRDHVSLVVTASQGQLLRASGIPATTWQSGAIPSLVQQRLLTVQTVSRGHYKAVQYTLTALGVQVAETTPLPQSETTPGSSGGVVSGSSRGRTLLSSSFLGSLGRTKKEAEEETPPVDDTGGVSGSSGGVVSGVVSESLLREALRVIAEQSRTILDMAKAQGIVPETCSCGQVKVERVNSKDGSRFMACPLFKRCPHYSKAESPAVESARKAREAAEKTRQSLQIRPRTA